MGQKMEMEVFRLPLGKAVMKLRKLPLFFAASPKNSSLNGRAIKRGWERGCKGPAIKEKITFIFFFNCVAI